MNLTKEYERKLKNEKNNNNNKTQNASCNNN